MFSGDPVTSATQIEISFSNSNAPERFKQRLSDITLRSFKQADRTFTLKNVEGLKLENVTIGGQRVDGRLDWRLTAARP